jgi:4-alpha-glucanotransferase
VPSGDGHSGNPHLPDGCVTNTVVYTGTRDNPTTRGWYEHLPDDQQRNMWSYLKRSGAASDAPALMDLAWSSPAVLAIAPLQNVLNLGNEARVNWRWRCAEDMPSGKTFERIGNLTKSSNRLGAIGSLN